MTRTEREAARRAAFRKAFTRFAEAKPVEYKAARQAARKIKPDGSWGWVRMEAWRSLRKAFPKLWDRFYFEEKKAAGLAKITKEERAQEIVRLYAGGSGHTYKEIQKILHISDATIKAALINAGVTPGKTGPRKRNT
jgi:ATP/maltotriose-dependent transcriptional regulator MalT